MARRIIGLWSVYGRMDVMWLLKDFNNFALYTVTDAAINVASVAGIWLIAARFNGIGGMGIYQVLFMLGYSLMVNGLISTFFSFNVYFISRIIGRGQMDHVLIMPQPVWVTLLTEGFTPVSGSGVLLSGIGVTTFALSRIDNLVSVPFVIALVGCIGLSVIISLSFSFMWGSLAFYSPVGAEEVCTSAGSLSWLSGFPLNGLESVSKYEMLSVLPIGLYAWFPSMALMGLSSSLNIALLAFIALAYLSLVLFFFTRGLKHYVKNGSYRYLDRGHRR